MPTITPDSSKGSADLAPADLSPHPVSRWKRAVRRLRLEEAGEGVISAAIAVLIMAFIGVAAFVAYRQIMGSVTTKTTECVNVYVTNGSSCQ
jgi:hypothetical protein